MFATILENPKSILKSKCNLLQNTSKPIRRRVMLVPYKSEMFIRCSLPRRSSGTQNKQSYLWFFSKILYNGQDFNQSRLLLLKNVKRRLTNLINFESYASDGIFFHKASNYNDTAFDKVLDKVLLIVVIPLHNGWCCFTFLQH